ncbi:MAG: hypothetical protein U5K31_06440 [Balneolaceae bacterium]|nr:hypothetical protein [Balneolaceae bacterium]
MRDYSDFTEKRAQAETERTVRELVAVDSLLVGEDIPELSLSYLELSESFIFSKSDEKLVKLHKGDLGRAGAITLPEGRGPGEVPNFRLIRFGVAGESLAFYDRNTQKTVVYDLQGNFQGEFLNGGYQPSGVVMADPETYYFQIMPTPGREAIFYEVRRQGNESMVSRRFQAPTEGDNLLAYGGSLAYRDGTLYFAGRPEPLLRRYDITGDSARLTWSREVIDGYDSANNYETPEERGDFVAFGYSDQAQYATVDLATDGRFLYSARHPNDREGYKYLDVYAVEDGDYLASFLLRGYPQHVAVDGQHIYTLEEEGERSFLMKYEKPDLE